MGSKNRRGRRDQNFSQAAKQYVALVAHQPQLTALMGMGDLWNAKSVQSHVKSAVASFLRAYPNGTRAGSTTLMFDERSPSSTPASLR
jgi:hypothetical protein